MSDSWEDKFWEVADRLVRSELLTCKEVVTVARMRYTRKSPYFRRHTRDLLEYANQKKKGFVTSRSAERE